MAEIPELIYKEDFSNSDTIDKDTLKKLLKTQE